MTKKCTYSVQLKDEDITTLKEIRYLLVCLSESHADKCRYFKPSNKNEKTAFEKEIKEEIIRKLIKISGEIL